MENPDKSPNDVRENNTSEKLHSHYTQHMQEST